jgi:hypothetical protein
LNEQELILQLRQGNEPSFRWVVENYCNRMFHTLLNILQYSKEVSIKATLIVVMKKKNIFLLNFDYPDEAGHGSKEKSHIKNKGRYINNQLVAGRSLQEDGSIKIIPEEKGKDVNGQKLTTFHHILVIGKI